VRARRERRADPVEVDGDTVWLSDRSGRRVLDVPSDLRLPPGPAPSDDPRDQFTHLELGPYARLCAVLRAGAERRPIDSAVAPPTFADGLACMRVLDAIRASAAAGGTCVDVPTG
jgi:predicted dehydrogenase